MSQAADLVEQLAAGGLSLATAESLTGGRLGALVTGVPGASRVYRGGVVAYATEVKQSVLGVPGALLEQHGAVSGECAEAMALGVREVMGATLGVSTTGVAGPDQQEGKPVGTVFVAVAAETGTASRRLTLAGDRETIREAACGAALSLLADIISGKIEGSGSVGLT